MNPTTQKPDRGRVHPKREPWVGCSKPEGPGRSAAGARQHVLLAAQGSRPGPTRTPPLGPGRSAPSTWRFLGPVLVLLSVILAHPAKLPAQPQGDEYSIKAAFLFHFAQLVEWPADALAGNGNSLTFCTFGEDPFQGGLEDAVKSRSAGTRLFSVRHVKHTQDLRGCQILFLAKRETPRIPTVLAGLRNLPVVTVGETDDFVQQGGMIRFCVENNKLRFEINLDAAERAHVTISSRLLLLAKNVVGAHWNRTGQ